jgi:hypothetical protein
MSSKPDPKIRKAKVTLEISVEKLQRLFVTGELCACDVRCADCASKLVVQQLCLQACAARHRK